MRKVSSHYYLRPDGTFGKRPIIQLDNEGRIINIREAGDYFKEEAGLEYYPGIIVPGFVASITEVSTYKRKRVQAVSNGVLRLKEGCDTLCSDKYVNAWRSIIDNVLRENSRFDLAHYLIKHTVEAARILNETEWGEIREGAKPGLLVIQKIDLRAFTVTNNSTFRLIQK